MNSYVISTLIKIINDALTLTKYEVELDDIVIEINKNNTLGDYSTPIAMVLAKKYQQNPLDIAQAIVKNISQKYPLIKSIDFIAPGFINFNINTQIFSLILMTIIKEKANFGKCEPKNITYIIEFISANPTGLLHLGHARNGAIGDSLANVLTLRGYQVIREYYVNDAGNQVAILANSIFIRYQNLCGLETAMLTDSYRGDEIIEAAIAFQKKYDHKYYRQPFDIPTKLLFQDFGIKYMLAQIKLDLKNFNIKIDNWFHESALYQNQIMLDLIAKLKAQGSVYEKDEAVWLKTTPYGDDKDRVIVKKDHTYTYMLPDLAYHDFKYQRSNLLINIWGADHYGYIPRIKAGLTILGHSANKIDILCMQMVRVIQQGKEQKMSKRAGTSITLRSMLQLIGKDALRYFMVSRAPETHLDIDLEIAKSNSNDNPVFYAQYAHARINQILQQKVNFIPINNIDLLTHQKEKELLITLDEYLMVLRRIETKHEPHLLTNYIQKLAKLFHSYYNECKVINDNESLTGQRLTLILAIKQILANALNLIGVKAPEKM